jgi:hypothetical protein
MVSADGHMKHPSCGGVTGVTNLHLARRVANVTRSPFQPQTSLPFMFAIARQFRTSTAD